jgi:hypothetical protein
LFDVDGRIVACIGERPRQHDVAVKDGSGGVGDRVLLVIAFCEHGVEGGDRTAAVEAVAGALDELRQACENRGRVAASDRRFADGQGNLALRHRVAGQRVHDQQHVPALIAEVFGDAGGVGCGPADASTG